MYCNIGENIIVNRDIFVNKFNIKMIYLELIY